MVGYYIIGAIGCVFTIGIVCTFIDMINPIESHVNYIIGKNSHSHTKIEKDPLIKDDFDMDEDEFYKNVD